MTKDSLSDYKLYVLAEIAYEKEHPDINRDSLYPCGWYGFNDYKLKVEIIGEALDKKVLVMDTKLYRKAVSGRKFHI